MTGRLPDSLNHTLSVFGFTNVVSAVSAVRPGFSGALLWKIKTVHAFLALRCWPASRTRDEVTQVQTAQQCLCQAGLPFIPALHPAVTGDTLVQQQGRLWELGDWCPGIADFSEPWRAARLQTAVEALVRVHATWCERWPATAGPSPGLLSRRRRLLEWPSATFTRAHRALDAWPLLWRDLLGSALDRLQRIRSDGLARLEPWLPKPLRLHTIHGDLWQDHLLFTKGSLTGLIDFGSVRVDSPAFDLARLLESVDFNSNERHHFLATYAANARGWDTADDRLLELLLVLAPVCGLETWLRWLLLEQRPMTDWNRIHTRITGLLLACSRLG